MVKFVVLGVLYFLGRGEDAMMISDPHVVVLRIAFYNVIPVVRQIPRILRFFRGTFCLGRSRALSPRFLLPILSGCGLDVATGQGTFVLALEFAMIVTRTMKRVWATTKRQKNPRKHLGF